MVLSGNTLLNASKFTRFFLNHRCLQLERKDETIKASQDSDPEIWRLHHLQGSDQAQDSASRHISISRLTLDSDQVSVSREPPYSVHGSDQLSGLGSHPGSPEVVTEPILDLACDPNLEFG